MSSISATNSNSGEQVLTAALAKNQQESEGKMALALIDAAATAAPVPQTTPAPSGNLGNHINIKA